MKVCVIGLGYIGLPTACLVSQKYETLGVDLSADKIRLIEKGECPIEEAGLPEALTEAIDSGKLKVSLSPDVADVFVIAVPTPFKEGNKPDISYVESAVASIAPMLDSGNLLIIESTIPIGCTDRVNSLLKNLRGDLFCDGRSVGVAHCPERVLPGRILEELVSNDRVVGGVNVESAQKAQDFYISFVQGQVVKVTAKVAEMTKLVENSYRDLNIAFANELSIHCDSIGVDVWDVIENANRHPRVNVLKPGVGVGGHCIAVDPWFLVDSDPEHTTLVKNSRKINDSKPSFVANKILDMVGRCGTNKVVLFGLAYKPDVDDFRESPAVKVMRKLMDHKIEIQVVEPYMQQGVLIEGESFDEVVSEMPDLDNAVVGLLVAHSDFQKYNPVFRDHPACFDACGMLQMR